MKPAKTTKKSHGLADIRQTLTPKKKSPRPLHVLKLNSIPFGFFEKEIMKYFRQFGNVIRVRVARSKKTGNHKGWAYVAFDDPDVAQIAAESMNGYLMFEKRVRAHVMKPEEVPEHMKKGDRLVDPPRRLGKARKETLLQWKEKPAEKVHKLKKRRAKLNEERLKKLREMGINYELPAKSSAQTDQKTHEVENGVEQENIQTTEVANKKKRSFDKKERKSIQEIDLEGDDSFVQEQPVQKKMKSAATPEVKVIEKPASAKKSDSPKTPAVEKKTPAQEGSQVKTPVLQTPKDKTPKSTTPIGRRVKTQRLTPARIAYQKKQEAAAAKEPATPKANKAKTPSRQRQQK